MAFLGRTIAVGNKIVEDIKKLAHVITILVSILFIGYYTFSVIINLSNLFYLIIYSSFLCISLITFILYLTAYGKKNKSKTFNRVLRIIKYVLNATMLSVNAYQAFTTPTSDLSIVLLIVSASALVLQILVEILRVCFEYYFSLLKTAVLMDFEFVSKFIKLKEQKPGIYGLINAPLEIIADKLQNKEPERTEEQLFVDTLAEKYELVKKEKKKAQQEEQQSVVETNAKKQKAEIKEHFGIIREKLKERFSNKKDS